MLHDEFVEENGQTYYLGSYGVRVSGLQDIKDKPITLIPIETANLATA